MDVKAKSAKIADLKAFLEAERARLCREISTIATHLPNEEINRTYGNHMADDATAVFEQEKNVGMKRAQQRRLEEVEDALRRIESGTYGVCQRCSRPIDAARLRAVPETAFCFSCQERFEHQER